MALTPVPIGFGAYSVAAVLSGIYVYGKEKGENSQKTLGVYAFLAGIALYFTSFVFVVDPPLGDVGVSISIQLLFALLTFIFGSVWFGFSITLFLGWDLKFIGDAALVLFTLHAIGFVILFKWISIFGLTGFIVLQINMVLYLIVESGFFLLTHGKVSARYQGTALVLSGIATYAVIFYTAGIIG